jgi:molybdenum cofactor cytidylyltransferase
MKEDPCCEPDQCGSARLRIGGVLLAAGEGKRLGGRPKGLIEIDGEPLVRRNLKLLRESGVDEVVLVTGHYREQIAAAVDGIAHKQVEQRPDTHTQADSLRLGLSALSPELDAILVLPVDMPALIRGDLVALMGAYKHAADTIEFVGPTVNGQPGNPVLFSQRIAAQIGRGDGPFGSGAWRQLRAPWLFNWQTDNTHYITDIDTPEELARWTRQAASP